jgi:hypothetical protein
MNSTNIGNAMSTNRSENPNESKASNDAISDSLAKVIREYDQAMKSFSSQQSFWRKKKHDEEAYSGGFLEVEERLLEAIRKIVETRKSKPVSSDSNPFSQKAFAYLEDRLKYHDQKQRRMPDELTADYKILLVGDGWAYRSDPDNPLVKEINQELKSINAQVKISGEMRQQHLNLQNRGFTPDQVYTVDRLFTGLPDLCGKMEEFKPNDLPQNYFDFIYFEGFGFANEEGTNNAVKVALEWLKNEGLILYITAEPEFSKILLAKSGVITQEKLDKIPTCIKTSINRNLTGFSPFEEVIPDHTQKINLTDKTRAEKKLGFSR